MMSNSFLKKLERLDPHVKEAMLFLAEELDSNISITRSDFNELKECVKSLANAQIETQKELKSLAKAQKLTEIRVEELAEAQKRTEIRVEELAEAQKRTEIRVEELAEAQKRTEKRVEELAEAQKRTEKRVEELAEAQKKTENEVRKLSVSVRDIRKQVGGLAMDVGYGIEDKIMPYVFDFGKKEFGIKVTNVERKNLVYPDGKYDEVNIYAEGLRNGSPVFIIGECKSQPGKKDFDKFSQMLDRAEKVIQGDIYPFIAGYHFSPDVEAYAGKKYPHIKIFRSYQFELRYNKTKLG